MKFHPAQMKPARCLLTLFISTILVISVSGQDTSEDPAQSVLKEQTATETTADAAAEEPKEFTPPAITLGSASGESPEELAFKPSTFEGIIPGVSKSSEVTEKLGEPRAKIETNGSHVLVYAMEPYDRVGIVIKEDLTDSIHLHFKQPAELKQLITEMGLVENTAVTQTTTSDKAFLLVWPEQGVTFHFKRNKDVDQVSRVSFTTIQAEAYLERGTHRQWFDYAGALSDAKAVQALIPDDERAFILEAQIEQRMGNVKATNAALEKAIQLAPGDTDLLLMQAGLTSLINDTKTMLQRVRAIRNNTRLSPLIRSRAAYMMGELVANSDSPDYKQAMIHHSESIQRARELMETDDLETQFDAIRLVIEGHLAVAHDIARGSFAKDEKKSVVPKWINISWELTDHLLRHDYHDSTIGMEVCRRALEALALLDEGSDITDWIDRVDQISTELKQTEGASPEYLERIKWEWALALAHATESARKGKDIDRVQQLGMESYQLFNKFLKVETVSPQWDNAQTHAAIGALCYTLGSVEAIDKQNHEEACKWYDTAVEYLTTEGVEQFTRGEGWHGERMVSMGLSYWKEGNRPKGLNLTRRGIQWIEQAVEKQGFSNQNLKIPYGNLVIMYKALGQPQEAEKVSDAAEALTKQR
ncbi:MAG: hypothetical protein CMJ76_00445 [Planctomycetaceae bacterium]|nr:hypothetical protein [Planctomycetaceae bacterium]